MATSAEILDVARRIVELERELVELRAKFERMVGPRPRAENVTEVANDEALPLPARVLALVRAAPGRTMDIGEIGSSLPKVTVKTLRTTLARLAKAGKLRRLGRGKYKAEEAVATE
jgi:hypothetical protein